MQAIILAAGMGKRLKDLTMNNTKCMVEVNGVRLIDRVLHQLDHFSFSRIILVVGYKREELKEFIGSLELNTPIEFVENEVYDRTNNIYSLYLAKDKLMEEDTILLESDIIFDESIIESLLNDPRETLALVDKYESWMDGTCVKIGEDDTIEAFIPGKNFDFSEAESYYKTVNIYKFSKHFSETHYVPFLEAYSKALGNNEYYEQVLRVITMLDEPEIRAKRLNGEKWYEIDDIQDLDIASSMFAEGRERLQAIQKRYGGYWRYPGMIDFCYLVNPYYPSHKMMDEMKAQFGELLTQYPSGMYVNSLLAARNFDVKQEYILVGNGAAELIKSLMERMEGRIGLVRPTFEEYPNRMPKERIECYIPSEHDFQYGAADLMEYFKDKDIQNLLLINPDNPTGNYIPFNEVCEIAKFCEERQITFIYDESFSDFAEEEKHSFLENGLLRTYPHMVVVKSLSKSRGIPGARLGIAASGDVERIADMKKDVAIWNINSFGEFYLQIQEKYEKKYFRSVNQVKESRRRLADGLSRLEGLRVLPSQANYLCIEITAGIKASELTEIFLNRYNLFIKDLSSKLQRDGRQFVRVAVRSDEDNEKLIRALEEILGA